LMTLKKNLLKAEICGHAFAEQAHGNFSFFG